MVVPKHSKMGSKVLIVMCLLIFLALEEVWSLGISSNSCPMASRIASCSPKCKDNSNCHGAQICCTNICGTKSCADINQYQSDNKSFKGSSSKGATGSYCGNLKCNSYEKCELDKTTKREKCVRS